MKMSRWFRVIEREKMRVTLRWNRHNAGLGFDIGSNFFHNGVPTNLYLEVTLLCLIFSAEVRWDNRFVSFIRPIWTFLIIIIWCDIAFLLYIYHDIIFKIIYRIQLFSLSVIDILWQFFVEPITRSDSFLITVVICGIIVIALATILFGSFFKIANTSNHIVTKED